MSRSSVGVSLLLSVVCICLLATRENAKLSPCKSERGERATVTVTARARPSSQRSVPRESPQSHSHPEGSEQTSAQCMELADMSGICSYSHLYYDEANDRLYFVTKEASGPFPQPAAGEQFRRMVYEDTYQLPFHFPVPKLEWVSYADNQINRESYLISPEYLRDNFDVVDLPGITYITHPAYPNNNPYYFAKDILQMWELEWLQWANPRFSGLPKIEQWFLGRSDIATDWQRRMMDFLLRKFPGTRVLLHSDIQSITKGSSLLRMER